jgi:hypothetical protein
MTESNTFPFFIHMITIPVTLGVGFFLGWVIRGAIQTRSPRGPGSFRPSA